MIRESVEYRVSNIELIKDAEQKIARVDAEILLARILGVFRSELYIYDKEIGERTINEFNALVSERATGKPLQYVTGSAEFMGLEFIVTPDVLIPRPETELLVETAIDILNTQYPVLNTKFILDLGTGSGNIAISLTKFMADCKILASDVSAGALSVARENAKRLLVDKKIDFVVSDLFKKLPKAKFDMIVSNPPYVASAEFGELAREIGFEPKIALDGGQAGIDVYRRIIKEAPRFLRNKGFLLLEIGFEQSQDVNKILKGAGFKNIKSVLDYNNINRIAVAQWIS